MKRNQKSLIMRGLYSRTIEASLFLTFLKNVETGERGFCDFVSLSNSTSNVVKIGFKFTFACILGCFYFLFFIFPFYNKKR